MRKETTFISDDGQKFDTEAECIEHERRAAHGALKEFLLPYLRTLPNVPIRERPLSDREAGEAVLGDFSLWLADHPGECQRLINLLTELQGQNNDS